MMREGKLPPAVRLHPERMIEISRWSGEAWRAIPPDMFPNTMHPGGMPLIALAPASKTPIQHILSSYYLPPKASFFSSKSSYSPQKYISNQSSILNCARRFINSGEKVGPPCPYAEPHMHDIAKHHPCFSNNRKVFCFPSNLSKRNEICLDKSYEVTDFSVHQNHPFNFFVRIKPLPS